MMHEATRKEKRKDPLFNNDFDSKDFRGRVQKVLNLKGLICQKAVQHFLPSDKIKLFLPLQQPIVSFVWRPLPQLVIQRPGPNREKMNETAHAQNINDRVYNCDNAWDHYYKNIRLLYIDPAKEEDPVLAHFWK